MHMRYTAITRPSIGSASMRSNSSPISAFVRARFSGVSHLGGFTALQGLFGIKPSFAAACITWLRQLYRLLRYVPVKPSARSAVIASRMSLGSMSASLMSSTDESRRMLHPYL